MSVEIEVVDLKILPSGDEILGPRERAFFQTLTLPKRKMEWLGGRLALKKLVSAQSGVTVKEIEILPQTQSGKPSLQVGGKPYEIPFSITHSHGYAVAAVAPAARYIGIDLEKIVHRMEAWKKDFFHPDELTGEGDAFLTALWTQKEAAVKLLGTGLTVNSFDVRCVQGKIQFFGRAQAVYEQLGAPQITLETSSLIAGFQFSVAVGK